MGLSKREYDPRNRWSLSGCREGTFLPLRACDGDVCMGGGEGRGGGGEETEAGDCFTCTDQFRWVGGWVCGKGGVMTVSHAQTSFGGWVGVRKGGCDDCITCTD